MNDYSTIPLRRCTKCGEEYPATTEYFRHNGKSNNGLRSRCKMCERARDHDYRIENIEHIRQQHRIYNREYQAAHPTDTEYMRRWQAENRSRLHVYFQNYRARKRSLLNDFSLEQRNYALSYFGDCCAVCGRPFYDLFGERTLALDHWIPISSDECPGTTVTNMIPLCHGIGGCNSRKHARDPKEWLVLEFGEYRARKIMARIKTYFEVARLEFEGK